MIFDFLQKGEAFGDFGGGVCVVNAGFEQFGEGAVREDKRGLIARGSDAGDEVGDIEVVGLLFVGLLFPRVRETFSRREAVEGHFGFVRRNFDRDEAWGLSEGEIVAAKFGFEAAEIGFQKAFDEFDDSLTARSLSDPVSTFGKERDGVGDGNSEFGKGEEGVVVFGISDGDDVVG